MDNKYGENSVISPAIDAFAISPDDDVDLAKVPKALYVGGAGNIAVYMAGVATEVVFVGVAAGTVLPIRPTRVRATNTTATSIVGLY